jgi:hypothetical protein
VNFQKKVLNATSSQLEIKFQGIGKYSSHFSLPQQSTDGIHLDSGKDYRLLSPLNFTYDLDKIGIHDLLSPPYTSRYFDKSANKEIGTS